MPVPHALLREAFALLSTKTLHTVAEHNDIRGWKKMTPAKLRLAQAALGKKGTIVADLCRELSVSSQTLYRHVSPTGELRQSGKKVFSR